MTDDTGGNVHRNSLERITTGEQPDSPVIHVTGTITIQSQAQNDDADSVAAHIAIMMSQYGHDQGIALAIVAIQRADMWYHSAQETSDALIDALARDVAELHVVK